MTATLSVTAGGGSCEPSLAWKAPLSATTPHEMRASETVTIRFSWADCGQIIRDESVVVEVVDAADPSYPVTSWVYGADLVIDDAAMEYRVDFSPSWYGLSPGAALSVRVFMSGQLSGEAAVRMVPYPA